MSKRLDVLRGLRGPGDAALFARVFLFATVVPLVLRLPLRTQERLLEPRRVRVRVDLNRAERVIAHTESAIAMGEPVVRRGCLTRGYTRYFFLRRAGLDVSLDFGMGTVNGRFEGHCWLVREGAPYLEKVDPRPVFARTYSFPSEPRHATMATE